MSACKGCVFNHPLTCSGIFKQPDKCKDKEKDNE